MVLNGEPGVRSADWRAGQAHEHIYIRVSSAVFMHVHSAYLGSDLYDLWPGLKIWPPNEGLTDSAAREYLYTTLCDASQFRRVRYATQK